MAITRIYDNAPVFHGLSTDIIANTFDGAAYRGASLYTTDDQKWYTVDELGVVHPYVIPLQGTFVPDQKTITAVTGTKNAAGDNTLIAAPAGALRICLAYVIIQNESNVATTAILKDGATAFLRNLAQNQGDGISIFYPSDTRMKLTAATALVLNLSGANSFGYSVGYYTE